MVSPSIAQAILSQQAPDVVGSFRAGREQTRQSDIRRLSGLAASGEEGSIQDLIALDPETGLALGEAIGARDARSIKSFIESAGVTRQMVEGGNIQGAIDFASQRLEILKRSGADTQQTEGILNLLQTDPARALNELRAFESSINQSRGLTAGQQERAALLKDLESDDPNVRKSAEIALRITAPAAGSAAQTIAAEGTAEEIAKSQAIIEKEKEGAKLEARLKFKPQIASAVKLAEEEAGERGDILTDLSRARAALPGLEIAVEQLRELSNIATSTFGGRVFDVALKETGFGSTKGATARAKFIAVVNNQVLPLLKPTFGGSFTVQEGEALKATMGDPDASPADKMAQLDAFIDQKFRDIESKEAQLSAAQPKSQQQDLSQLSIEELQAQLQQAQ